MLEESLVQSPGGVALQRMVHRALHLGELHSLNRLWRYNARSSASRRASPVLFDSARLRRHGKPPATSSGGPSSTRVGCPGPLPARFWAADRP